MSNESAYGSQIVIFATPLTPHSGIHHLNIAGSGIRRHGTGQCRLHATVEINVDINKAQVVYHAVTLDFAEQTRLQAADGVAVTVIVTGKSRAGNVDVMMEAALLNVVAICRVAFLPDHAQCGTV